MVNPFLISSHLTSLSHLHIFPGLLGELLDLCPHLETLPGGATASYAGYITQIPNSLSRNHKGEKANHSQENDLV